MIEQIKNQVFELLKNDNSGHDINHIKKVLMLSLKFAEQEKANVEIVALIALLHDVDDYKLFGVENAKNLSNAIQMMNNAKVDEEKQKQVLESLKSIGYSKLLKGIRPKTIEGKIVSDADMCDAMGARGILRVYKYNIKHGKEFFDRDVFPIEDIVADEYVKKNADNSVCHIFEKILKLKDLMMTESGKVEAGKRQQIIIDFLYHLFDEEDAYEWKKYLDEYLEKQKLKLSMTKNHIH